MSNLRIRPRGPLHRGVIHDRTVAEHEAILAVTRKFRDVQTTFDRGKTEQACAMLMNLALSLGKSDRLSFHLRIIETARVIIRVTNSFGMAWENDEPGYIDLENLEIYTLSDDVLLSKTADPLGYAYDDIFRVARSAGDSWTGAGEFRPGYDDTDVQIRFARLKALAREYAADQNMSRAEANDFMGRCYPTIESDDPRYSRFCTE